MNKRITAFLLVILTILSLFSLTSCEQAIIDGLDHAINVLDELEGMEDTSPDNSDTQNTGTTTNDIPGLTVDKDGSYDDRDHVALYIHLYGELPKNYITKKEAEALGWNGGPVEKYAEGKCIGGSYFSNYEGLLPKKDGRSYYECDIDTLGENSRGAKRIVYSNDGLVYYTDDHYESFELLYGEE